MAGPATNGENQSQELETTVSRDVLRETAARLYAQGFNRAKISRILLDHLVPNKFFDDGLARPEEQLLAQARKKLRNWERDDKFRALVYAQGLIKVDLASGVIMDGLVKKAKKGRVDASRLLFEMTGRHNPRGEAAPTQISVVIAGMPRPESVQAVTATPQAQLNGHDLELEVLDEEDDV